MRYIKRILLCASLCLCVCLTIILCGCKQVKFDADEIDHITINMYSSTTENKCITLTPEENQEDVDKIYEAVKELKFNKSFPTKDFWSREELTYDRPDYGKSIDIICEDGATSLSLFIDTQNRVYKSGDYRHYAEKAPLINQVINKYY